MNVVQREKRTNIKVQTKFTNELVRKDSSHGIRGATLMPLPYGTSHILKANKAPRYQFNNEESTAPTKKLSMGPPSGPPRSLKRRIINSSSSKTQTSSDKVRPRILASDSAVADTSHDIYTPRNRPTALRYISSSSRGGHSGTRSARSTSTSAVEASVILAISEGRGMARGEIGIAAIDLRHPHLVLCQFSDTLLYTHTLTKINYFNPVEIIVPHTFCEGVQPNQLYQLIKDQYPLVTLTTVQRRHFNDSLGRQNIQSLCAPQYSAVYLQVLHKFYALTAAAAVLKYVEYIQCLVFARESLKIEYHSSENTMIIDVGTATQLELVQPLVPSAGPSCCLLGVLGPTYTIGGIRALRAAILQPSCKNEFIENRLNAVQDLIDNDSGLMVDIQDVIKKLSDIDKILFLCVESSNQNTMDKLGEAQLNQTLLLKTTMDMVPNLVEALSSAESGRLRKIKLDFENPNYKEIADRIHKIIQDDAHPEKGAMGSLQRCFAVRPEINGLLDVARRTYSELIEDTQKIVEQLSETHDLPLRLNQNMMKGFHIVLPIAPKNRRSFNIEELPPIFIQVHHSGASVSMTTEELVVLDQQAKESLNEILKMSNIVVSGLLQELRPFMPSLYTLCENVAELDILLALAQASSIGSYIRPNFNSYMDVRNSVHPLLDYNSQVRPVANDIYASPEQNFIIITGPNMGGKSIYLKQIALMQIMAQLGCFVPATNAVLRLSDRIFSRIGFNDSVELNASTYVFEMKEMQHILKELTSTSLIIIDELCRGTSTEEGTSIAWAICEELLLSDAFTFFTTHFMYLTRLQDLYFNVTNCHAAVTEEDTTNTQNPEKRLVYQHKIEPGVTKIEHYGLLLASKTNLPVDTVNLARELADFIKKSKKPQEITTPQKNCEEALYMLNAKVRKVSRTTENAESAIKHLLQKFKEENPNVIESLKVQRGSDKTDYSGGILSSLADSRPPGSSYDVIVRRNSDLPKPYKSNRTPPDLKTPEYITSNNSQNVRDTSINLENVDLHKPFNTDNNYTTVRSSDELLNTIMINDNSEHYRNENISLNYELNIEEDLNNGNQNIQLSDTSIQYNNPDDGLRKAVCSNVDKNDISLTNSSHNNDSNDVEIHENENQLSDGNNTNKPVSDSDIAEALTQVLKSCSVDDMSIHSEYSSDTMSVDEELMKETVDEINNEFENGLVTIDIESIILTPPMDYRDY